MQKYNHGDLVHIVKDLGSYKTHFQSDKDAIIIASYAQQFGGYDDRSYTIYIENYGETSWYEEDQLILIEKNRCDILEKWKTEAHGKKEKELL